MPKAKSNLPPKHVPKTEDPLDRILGLIATQRPPTYRPRIPGNLNLVFAADPFDGRFVDRNRNLTALGTCCNLWWWFKRHESEVGPAFAAIAGAVRLLLIRECPDTFEELERHGYQDPEMPAETQSPEARDP